MSGPRWLNETEMQAWTGFLETYDLLSRLVDRQLREDGGVTQVQYEILTRINEGPNRRRRMTELADLMVCSRSGLTYQVGQLVKAGLLVRETDSSDERGVLAILTDAGAALLEGAAPGHLQTVRDGFIDVLTEEQVGQLAEIMDATRRHLRGISGLCYGSGSQK
ncbi:MarR family winged helix-turn-helix transcriptional regulator [Kitasatospora viridis]|uniref:DNA-binding MarR family transcriptional regulator n=1 Tax=Kitasatospora viridis TaxID=281105 RepID=A0A561UMA4_9ACTN|nr:MarR family winged helix-turn-helix transcriptional regulator [Kitasatospora viridis]TWG00501.1 DNA-binding MarR family transcriptional regulator [Kitasatospora viridis]